jgi:hypothetical protein
VYIHQLMSSHLYHQQQTSRRQKIDRKNGNFFFLQPQLTTEGYLFILKVLVFILELIKK